MQDGQVVPCCDRCHDVVEELLQEIKRLECKVQVMAEGHDHDWPVACPICEERNEKLRKCNAEIRRLNEVHCRDRLRLTDIKDTLRDV